MAGLPPRLMSGHVCAESAANWSPCPKPDRRAQVLDGPCATIIHLLGWLAALFVPSLFRHGTPGLRVTRAVFVVSCFCRTASTVHASRMQSGSRGGARRGDPVQGRLGWPARVACVRAASAGRRAREGSAKGPRRACPPRPAQRLQAPSAPAAGQAQRESDRVRRTARRRDLIAFIAHRCSLQPRHAQWGRGPVTGVGATSLEIATCTGFWPTVRRH